MPRSVHALAEEGRLLVARDPRDRDRPREEPSRRVAVDLAARAHLGEHGARDAEHVEQLVVPVARVDVVQQGPAGVRGVGDVERAAGQLPDEPGVHRAEAELAALGPLPGALDVVEDPADLRAGEVRSRGRSPVFRRKRGSWPAVPEAVAEARGAPVLPDDRVVNGPPGPALPDDRRLALVRDADRGEVVRREPGARDGLRRDAGLRRPDLGGVVLHPAGPREDLRSAPSARRRRSAPARSKTIARELVVPWSRASTYFVKVTPGGRSRSRWR